MKKKKEKNNNKKTRRKLQKPKAKKERLKLINFIFENFQNKKIRATIGSHLLTLRKFRKLTFFYKRPVFLIYS